MRSLNTRPGGFTVKNFSYCLRSLISRSDGWMVGSDRMNQSINNEKGIDRQNRVSESHVSKNDIASDKYHAAQQ